MKKLFIKAAVVTLLFGTISGCKGAMPAQAAQTEAKYMEDVLIDEAHKELTKRYGKGCSGQAFL